ncbi:MAG: hypothetical protein ACK5VV_09205 [Lysobacteraceae bacterium]
MSQHSQAKRAARKKREKKAANAAASRRTGTPFVAHAHLVDEAGALVAAGGLHGAEWVMVVAGRALDGIDSPGLLIAMLKHTAARCEAEGRGTTLRLSPVLEQAAAVEAAEGGHTLDAWLALLEAERAERAEMKRAAAGGPGPQVH